MNDRRDRPNVRRALSHVGGKVELQGDAALGTQISVALDVPTSEIAEEAARAHVHGFHSYPAKMHPLTARRLIESFSDPGDVVLDPFCGSGTVLVEARLTNRRAVGVDANPLAVRLASRKLREASEKERTARVEAARAAAAHADERRKTKAGPTRRYGAEDLETFDRHVLLELDGVRAGIERTTDPKLRADLELVLSAILTKLSRRTSDTSSRELPRRIAAGFPSRLFIRKAEELAKQLSEVALVMTNAPSARVLEGDARVLTGIEDRSVNLIVTSPPYPGVYDYIAHHEVRLRWLGLRTDRFATNEIGARRRLDALGPSEGVVRWEREIGAAVAAMDRVLVSGGLAVLLLADSVIAGKPIYAVDSIRHVLAKTRLRLGAVASQKSASIFTSLRDEFLRRVRAKNTPSFSFEDDAFHCDNFCPSIGLWHDPHRSTTTLHAGWRRMMRNVTSALLLLLAFTLIGCAKKSTGDGSVAASDGAIGVSECDAYVGKMNRFLDTLPSESRAAREPGFKSMQAAWRETAQNPAAKESLAATCKAQLATLSEPAK